MGAGPGHPWLLTLWAKKRLEEAEVVLHDRLIHPSLLRFAKKAKKINVGKQPGKGQRMQKKIEKLMRRYAREGKRVVRLKGGDPLLFSRGAEEASFLFQQKIPFEIVPGVSSATAVSALAGIPLTHRECSHSVAFFTGQTKGKPLSVLPKADTLVGLMSVKQLEVVVSQLLKHFPATTSSALIHWGSTPQQKVITGDLKDIVRLRDQHAISPPALLIVGEVVQKRSQMAAFTLPPLFGKRAVVIRPETTETSLVDLLEAQGAFVQEHPVVEIIEEKLTEKLKRQLTQLAEADVLTFTSQNGVKAFFTLLAQSGFDARHLASCTIAAVGKKTAEALARRGVLADLQPRKFTVVEMLKEIKKTNPEAKVWMIRGRHVRPSTEEKRLFPDLRVLYVYRAHPNREGITALRKLLQNHEVDLLPFTSAQQVEVFMEGVVRGNKALLKDVLLFSIGPSTTRKLRAYGFANVHQARSYTLEDLVAIMVKKGGKHGGR